jgi:hypothetical protein
MQADDFRSNLQADRATVETCIGCGSMRTFSACGNGCDERPVELVSAGDYDALIASAAACRERLGLLLAPVDVLSSGEDDALEWRAVYLAARMAARTALANWRATNHQPAVTAAPLETVTVWRCQDCGGLDAPQPCIGVCKWYASEWIDALQVDRAARMASDDEDTERRLVGLLGRLAHSTPHDEDWERSVRALRAEAQSIDERSRGGAIDTLQPACVS